MKKLKDKLKEYQMKLKTGLLAVLIVMSFAAKDKEKNTSSTDTKIVANSEPIRIVTNPPDNQKGLNNPDMGWYYYKYDNNTVRYGTRNSDDETFDYWPGMTAIYYRIAWGHLEPEKGKYNWDLIDRSAKHWIAAEKKICFRITASEVYDGATPDWVGTGYDPDNPVFLEALDNFLSAFAARYDGKPYVAYIDVGSIGIWGEGHGDIDYSVKIKHIDLHLKHFKNSFLVVNDDYGPEACDYARQRGLSIRDDSVMWNDEMFPTKVSFDQFWPTLPTILETAHYGHITNKLSPWNIGWSNEALLATIEEYHASWVSVHGWPDNFWRERQECIAAANLRMGYRLQLTEASWIREVATDHRVFFITKWRNAGVAPCYNGGYVAITLKNNEGSIVAQEVNGGFNVRSLEPGPKSTYGPILNSRITLRLSKSIPNGEYQVFVSVGAEDGTPVYELPYNDEDGSRRFLLGKIYVKNEIITSLDEL